MDTLMCLCSITHETCIWEWVIGTFYNQTLKELTNHFNTCPRTSLVHTWRVFPGSSDAGLKTRVTVMSQALQFLRSPCTNVSACGLKRKELWWYGKWLSIVQQDDSCFVQNGGIILLFHLIEIQLFPAVTDQCVVSLEVAVYYRHLWVQLCMPQRNCQ